MLLTDSKAWSATRPELSEVPLPSGTSSYTPVPHETFLQGIHVQLPAFGLKVDTEQLALAREGKQMFGVLSCTNGHDDRGLRLAIGLRNSYDRSLSCGLVAGLRVVVCSNLCFSGEVEMRRRHTSNVLRDLPSCIDTMMSDLKSLHIRQLEQADRLKSARLDTDADAHDLMMRAVRAKAFPASKLPRVIGEWDSPTHEEFEGRTAWSLLNAFTEVQKRRGPSAQMDVGLMRVFSEAV